MKLFNLSNKQMIVVIIKLVTGIIYKSNWLEVLAVYMISHSTKMIKKQEL